MDVSKLENEFRFTTSRSSGPGGQSVNKSNTKVTLHWDIMASEGLSESQKEKIVKRLRKRISNEGIISISSDKFRSQKRNKEETVQKLQRYITKALTPKKKRIKTVPTKGSKEQRLKDKKNRADIKRLRKPPKF